jgi:hypothetical protein
VIGGGRVLKACPFGVDGSGRVEGLIEFVHPTLRKSAKDGALGHCDGAIDCMLGDAFEVDFSGAFLNAGFDAGFRYAFLCCCGLFASLVWPEGCGCAAYGVE